MARLRWLLFSLIFYVVTLLWVLAGILGSPLGGRWIKAVVLNWTRVHAQLARHLIGVTSRVEGTIPRGAYLIAVKHQAQYETMEMVRLNHLPVMVIKKELADIPLFGWMTRRYGVIPVERSAGAKALRNMVAAGRDAVAEGRPVIIFPEGTRVPVGATPPLRPGFAGLYRALGLPVVPVAMNSGRLVGRGAAKRSGIVTFKVGEIIPPGLGRGEIESRVHAAINVLESASQAGA